MGTTNFPKGVKAGYWPRTYTELTANYTVVINDDAGKTFVIKADGITITLPAIAIGNTFTFINGMPDGHCLVTIDCNAADGISFAGSATDGVTLINAKATAKLGDSVTLAALDQVVAWQVTNAIGTWAKGA